MSPLAERFFRAARGVGFGLAALALALPLAAGAQTLARFADGSSISADELRAYVAKRPDLAGALDNRWSAAAALQEMATTAALVREGQKRGLVAPGGAEPRRFDDIYAHRVYKEIAPACERPADAAAAKKYFDDHPEAFVVPARVRVSRVMLPVDATADGQAAADWMMAQARAVAADRNALAAAIDEAEKVNPSDVQGDLGWVVLDSDHPLIAALRGAGADDLVGPVEEDGFVYLFYVEATHAARQLTWEQAASGAATRAQQYCREHAQKDTRERLFAEYGVHIDDDALANLFR